jgi:ribosomal protein L21E
MFDSLEYIRKYFGVPAKMGTRVKYEGKTGRITGATGEYIKIKMDGEKKSYCYHASWKIEYM